MGKQQFLVIAVATVSALGVNLGQSAAQPFEADKVALYSQLTLADFGGQFSGANDCWGYVSPSGREYAFIGLNTATAVVEVTDPVNPVIVALFSHPDSTTGDIKINGEYAYSVGDRYRLQILDLRDIDNGNVRLAAEPFFFAHNIAINTDSGFAYLCASSVNSGITALDLSDPENPTVAGSANPTGNHVHDAQIVSYTSGQYAGMEVAFAPSGQSGLDIIDVTNKSNMQRLGFTTYPGLSYSHQGWLSGDRKYFYLDDELDELGGFTQTTRTLIFDVQDLTNPTLVDTFTSGETSTDHNLYVHQGFIYESNYTSGLQIFETSDPIAPVRVGYFDTFPSSNRLGFEGAWSNYPFYPSGLVIISDRVSGLIMVDASEARGERSILAVSPLTGGQQGTFTITNGVPNSRIHFAYSLTGLGWTNVPILEARLQLDNPVLAGSAMTDSQGNVTWQRMVPQQASGLTVWIQAIQFGKTSTVVETTVN